MNKITLYLIFAWIVAVVVAAYPTFVQGQVICNERAAMLHSLENSFGEKVAEQGVDEGLLVVISVNLDGKWSLLLTPKGRINTFCVPITGSNWTQDKNVSHGITYNGSVLTIIQEDNGNWKMIYMDKKTGKVDDITAGYGWERIIKFDELLENTEG